MTVTGLSTANTFCVTAFLRKLGVYAITILFFIIPDVNGQLLFEEPEDEEYLKLLRRQQHRDQIKAISDGKVSEAITHLKDYLERYPWDLENLFGLSVAYAAEGDIQQAMNYVRRAVRNGLPVERFLAGPRELLDPLLDTAEFSEFIDGRYERLVHGPMLGRVTDRGAAVWVRSFQPAEILVRAWEGSDEDSVKRYSGTTSEQSDFTTVVEMPGLKAATQYNYEVWVDGSRFFEKGNFRTQPAAGQSLQATFGFGGGAGYMPWRERMWDTLRTHQFNGFFLLGDNVYIDQPEHPDVQQYCYYRRQSRPEYRRFVSDTPVYAIWDDHDFGDNDSWGGPEMDEPYWKPTVFDIFRQNWVNPYYGGGDENPGVWFDVSVGDIDFIFLDGRYYREYAGRHGGESVENPSMLGAYQLEWLKQKLVESDATFKVLLSPVPWASDTKPYPGVLDTWDGYTAEREDIFSFIENHQIEGVILVSADRHRSDLHKIPRPDGYDFYDLMSSRLTNFGAAYITEHSLFGYNQKNSFGTLSFDTTLEDPELSYSIYNIDNELIYKRTFYRSELEF